MNHPDRQRGSVTAFVAIVADHTRHSPGTRGAKMLIGPNGLQIGTIGGGVMEGRMLEVASSALAAGATPSLDVLHHRERPEGSPSGLICAGRQTMVYFVARPHHLDLAQRRRALGQGVDRDVDAKGLDSGPVQAREYDDEDESVAA